MSKSKSRRQPLSPSKYLAIHQGKMTLLYAEGIVVDDTLQWDTSESPVILLFGAVRFGSPVELKIKKWLKLEKHKGKECLVTKRYSYQCHVVGLADSEIFRYDNYHEDNPHEGHVRGHHVHRFDPPGRNILSSPFEINEADRPLMDEVIREAHEHSKAHMEKSSSVPTNGKTQDNKAESATAPAST